MAFPGVADVVVLNHRSRPIRSTGIMKAQTIARSPRRSVATSPTLLNEQCRPSYGAITALQAVPVPLNREVER